MAPLVSWRAVGLCAVSAVLLVGGFALAASVLEAFRGDIASDHQAATSEALSGASVDSEQAFLAAILLLGGAAAAVIAAVGEKKRFGDSLARHPVVQVIAYTLAGVGVVMGLVEVFIGFRMGSPGWAIVCRYGC